MISLYFNRALRCGFGLVLFTMLSGCTFVGSLYQSAPKLALFELNSTLDLNSAQYDQGVARLETTYQWHRKTELPAIVAQLRATSLLVQRGANPAQAGALLDWGIATTRKMVAYTVPQQVELAQSLTPDNLAALQKKYTKDNAKFRKEWGVGEPDATQIAQEKRFDTFVTWAERIYGDLSKDQLRTLRTASDARVLRIDWVLEERLFRQQTLLAVLRANLDKKLSTAQLQAALVDYAAKFDRASTPEKQAYLDQSRAQLLALVAQLSQLASLAQRNEAHKTLQGFAQTFQDIHDKP